MSIFDLDTDSAMMSRHDPKQIRARQFARTRKGFDPDQVRAFLDEVATQMEQLQSELRFAQEEGEAASRRAGPDPYTQLGAHVAELVRDAEEHAERIRGEANQEAERVIGEAGRQAEQAKQEAEAASNRATEEAAAHADGLRQQAEGDASRMREEAQTALERATAEAEASVAVLRKERERLLTHVQGARERLGMALDGLDQALASMGTDEEGSGSPGTLHGSDPDQPDQAISQADAPPAPAEHIASEDEAERRAKRPTELPPLPDIWELTAQLERDRKDEESQMDHGAGGPSGDIQELVTGELEIEIPDIPLIDERNDPRQS